jgi:hypothetical protein
VPRTLVFNHGGAELGLSPEKLDRGKLYGSVEVEALDEHGRRCELMSLGPDGKTLIGRGGKAMGFISDDGQWVDRSALQALDGDGRPIEPIASSFDAPIVLEHKTTVDDYLSHIIKSVYVMHGDPPGLAGLADELRAGAIYKFDYSFRGGLVADVGFLLASADDTIFLAVGQPTHLHFLGLEVQPAYEEETEAAEATGEDDELDFGMM